MKLKSTQLTFDLKKRLMPIYFISGDEPLLMDEACQAVRAKALAQGFQERELIQENSGEDIWAQFSFKAASLSLFSQKILLELRLKSYKLSDKAKKMLQQYAENPPSDKLLLIRGKKLESRMMRAAWVNALDKVGVLVQVWPLELSALPAWIKQRCAKLGIKIESSGVNLLAENSEGNLLALAQDLEKLALLYPDASITLAQVEAAIGQHARYTVFQLADSVLQGNAKRIMRILFSLQQEGSEPTLVLWALTRELRLLVEMQAQVEQGTKRAVVLAQLHTWEKRKSLYQQALQRYATSTWHRLLQHAMQIDWIIKGGALGNRWDELACLALAMGGTNGAITKTDWHLRWNV